MSWSAVRRRLLSNMYLRTMRSSFNFIILFITIITLILLSRNLSNIQEDCSSKINPTEQNLNINDELSLEKAIIFIGGMPRSGTTLMRVILDSHPLVRCGEETRVIPRILSMRAAWKRSSLEWNRLMSAGLNETILNSAVRAFIYEILIRHSQYADVLCDKDPFILKYSAYLSSMFPNAKFLLLIRDARAVIHSIITRKVTVSGFDLKDYRRNLRTWNNGVEIMVDQCAQIGKDKCMHVYYEQLVLNPKKTIRSILKFLHLSWINSVLHHEELIGKKISLSRTEHSSNQVIKPINLEALTKWIDTFPNDVKDEIDNLAPMLKKLGYDTQSDIPTYGIPDQLVLDNMKKLKENAEYWNAKDKSYARVSSNDARLFGSSLSVNRTIL